MIPVFPGRATCAMAVWTSCIWVSQKHPCATGHCGPLHLSTVTKAHASATSRRHARHLRPSPLTTRGMLTSARQCAPLLSCHGGLLLCISHCSRPTTLHGTATTRVQPPRHAVLERREASTRTTRVPTVGASSRPQRRWARAPDRRHAPRGRGVGRRQCLDALADLVSCRAPRVLRRTRSRHPDLSAAAPPSVRRRTRAPVLRRPARPRAQTDGGSSGGCPRESQGPWCSCGPWLLGDRRPSGPPSMSDGEDEAGRAEGQ
jgi:hypothetical protein